MGFTGIGGFSLFISHIKHKGLWSWERIKCFNFSVALHIVDDLEGNVSFDTISEIQQLLLKVFWSSDHSSEENFTNEKQLSKCQGRFSFTRMNSYSSISFGLLFYQRKQLGRLQQVFYFTQFILATDYNFITFKCSNCTVTSNIQNPPGYVPV